MLYNHATIDNNSIQKCVCSYVIIIHSIIINNHHLMPLKYEIKILFVIVIIFILFFIFIIICFCFLFLFFIFIFIYFRFSSFFYFTSFIFLEKQLLINFWIQINPKIFQKYLVTIFVIMQKTNFKFHRISEYLRDILSTNVIE